jgi:hypothetical protein
MTQSILCTVPDPARAEQVVGDLRAGGYYNEEISVLLPDQREVPLAEVDSGGELGRLAGIGCLAVPGAGTLLSAGPIRAALGDGAGELARGLAGALIGMGVPEREARQYEGRLREGKVLLSVLVTDRERRQLARDILDLNRAQDIAFVEDAPVPAFGRTPYRIRRA